MLQEWETPYQTPPFHLFSNEHYAPAVRAAIKETEKAIQLIVDQQEAPTFENTIESLEMASEKLDQVVAILLNLNECNTDPQIQDIVLELMPEITRHENAIWMNRDLFERVKTVYNYHFYGERGEVVEKYYQRFVRNGVDLEPDKQSLFAANAEELSTRTEQFSHNALEDTNNFTLHITDREQLSGLPANVVAAAREEAESRHLDGWVFTLHAPSYRPFLAYADDRDLREQMWRAYNSRGNRDNDNNNSNIIRRIVQLRLEQAKLLGYSNYAEYSLTRTMAQTPNEVNAFLTRLHKASLPFAKRDLNEVRDYARSIGADFELQSWDFSYYSEKLKKARYDFDSEALRPYFQLDKVRLGIFNLYHTLYGLTFDEASDIEVYNDEVRAYRVSDGNRFMGILYLDMFPRSNKRSGAWMTEFRCQSNLGGKEIRPLIQVVCNFSKPTADKPSLLSFDEVETFMHEMGHAMHGMLSDVHCPSVSGTSVRHDFVEMPSQVMENWCYETDFLNTFACHYQTGELIPTEFIDKIRRSENYLAGWLCIRQLNFGMTDMAYHTITEPLDDTISVEDFENQAMTQLLPTIDGCCTSTAFTHIFSGGYAAGYYGYKWAEVLDADIFSKFKADGIFNSDTARAFRNKILSRGGSVHPLQLFRDFMGRDPNPDALLRRCGFDCNY